MSDGLLRREYVLDLTVLRLFAPHEWPHRVFKDQLVGLYAVRQ